MLYSLTDQTIYGMSGLPYELEEMIDFGSQGVLYKVKGGKYLAKLINDQNIYGVKEIIQKFNIIKEIELPEKFIKPLDIIEKPYPGYVMHYVKEHVSLNKLLQSSSTMPFSQWYNTYSGGLLRRLLIGYKIAEAFEQLHSLGRAYCDISGRNIMVCKDTKYISICLIDIDNIYTAGNGRASVIGTPRYIAPEVLNMQMQPDIITDNYSLSVILFELLSNAHPYLGDIVLESEPEMENQAYRGKLPYIFDKNDTRNICSSALPEKVIFTSALSEIFELAFIKAQANRILRPTATDLKNALWDAANKVIRCNYCNAWFYPVTFKAENAVCPWCDNVSSLPPRLQFFDIYQKLAYKNKEIPSDMSVTKEITTYFFRNRKAEIDMSYLSRTGTFGTSEAFSVAWDNATNKFYVKLNNCDIRIILARQSSSLGKLELKYNEPAPIYNNDKLVFFYKGFEKNKNQPLRYAKFNCE